MKNINNSFLIRLNHVFRTNKIKIVHNAYKSRTQQLCGSEIIKCPLDILSFNNALISASFFFKVFKLLRIPIF